MKRWIPFVASDPVVHVVRLQGAIGVGGRGGLNEASIGPLITRAFKRGKPAAVAVAINSPGGSPVQSSLIGARLRRLADETDVPLIAFVEDVAASGGYWLACVADEIFADPSSILGSIGVISAGFGAHEFLIRQGFERRVHTAGQSKSMMDPFRPEKEEDVARLNRLLTQIHDAFITHVKTSRGTKLVDDPDLFTGEIWVGKAAVDVGLADGIGHLEPEMKARFGDKTKFRYFGQRKPWFQRLGAQMVDDGVQMLEERALFARFGL